MKKFFILWLATLCLLTVRAQGQCPAVTNVGAYAITSTSVGIGAFFNSASSYTFTYQSATGTPTSFTRNGNDVSGLIPITGLQPSTTYTLSLVANCANGQASAPATTTFTTYPPPAGNDNCAAAFPLPVTADCATPTEGSVVSTTESLPGQASCASGPNDHLFDVWYRFTATGPTQILTLTASFNPIVELRTDNCAASSVLFCNLFYVASGTVRRQLEGLTPGQSYLLRIASTSGIQPPVGSRFTLCLTPGPPVPPNDECAAAIPLLVFPSCRSMTGTLAGATPSTVPSGSWGRPTGPHDVWYSFNVTNITQKLTLEAVDHTQSFWAEVWQDGCTPRMTSYYSVVNQRDNPSSLSTYAPGVLTLYNCVPGTVYHVRVTANDYNPSPITIPRIGQSAQFTLCVEGLLACPAPIARPTTTTSTTAQLAWTNASASLGRFELEYGLQGFAPGTGTLIPTGNSDTYLLTGLRPTTDYCYYVREYCGGTFYGGTSTLGGPYCFRTTAPPAGCTPPTALSAINQTTTSTQLTWTYTPSTTPGISDVFDLEYGPQGFTPGTGTLLTTVYWGYTLANLLPGTDYCAYVRRNCGDFVGPVCFRTQGPTTPPDLVVSTAQTLAGGSYRDVTITSTGTLNLTGDLAVAGTLTVQSGGTLRTRYLNARNEPTCATLIGAGSFDLQDGATLVVCAAQGLTTSGSNGTVQLRGARTFSPGASYAYEGLPSLQAQNTGPGLPTTVRNLYVGGTTYNNVLLSRPLAVREVLGLRSGDLNTGGQPLTLLSSASGTALVDNTGGRVIGNATVQRFITGSYTGPGYRHFAAPILNATVASLTTSGYTPVVNPAYNTATNPALTVPFPTVYAYDPARLATSPAVGGLVFDKGWVSPGSLADPLTTGRGYSVHLPGTALVSFTGTLTTGSGGFSGPISQSPDATWLLVGNPFPSPLDSRTFRLGTAPQDNLQNVGAAIYVYESTGPYVGSYRTVVAGIGGSATIASGQGFFVRALPNPTGQLSANVNFFNGNRVTTFSAADNDFRRGTPETRPVLTLALRAAGLADPTSLYFTPGATAGFDLAHDALKLRNPSGLNLASQAGAEDYAVNGLPLLGTTPLRVPLTLAVPAAGPCELTVEQLLNFAPGTRIYLFDALLGTTTPLTDSTRYACTLAGTTVASRFSLEFRPAGALTAAPPRKAAQLELFPNPAPTGGSITIRLAAPAGPAATATLLNALGQVVRHTALARQGTQLSGQLPTTGLAAGVYLVRVQAGASVLLKRLAVE